MSKVIIRTLPCVHCRKSSDLEITQEQYRELMDNKKSIQSIFYDWPVEKREQLITGTHPKCWDEIFNDSEEQSQK